jgi:hypothetical protein
MKTGHPLGMVQILNNIPKLKQLSTNQKVSKQTVKKIHLEALETSGTQDTEGRKNIICCKAPYQEDIRFSYNFLDCVYASFNNEKVSKVWNKKFPYFRVI